MVITRYIITYIYGRVLYRSIRYKTGLIKFHLNVLIVSNQHHRGTHSKEKEFHKNTLYVYMY